MIRSSWTSLDENDREAFRATVAFLEGRLEERGTVHWALKLKPSDTIKRLALLELVDSPYGRKISEPWRSAWRLIKDSWSSPVIEGHGSSQVYDAQERLIAGDRSGSLVTTIVELVAPRLKVEPFTSLSLRLDKTTKRPKKVEDLLSTRLTSGQLVDTDVLKLGVLTEGPFLVSLAHALDALVATGLDMGRGIGWDSERHLWRLGQLHRVYYVPPPSTDPAYDPDRFHRGIAPSVKLLHTVVSRLVDIDISGALDFVRRWKLTKSPIHLRLWAALSRDSRVTSSKEVASTLLALDNRRFWDLDDYPEIAELRAKRFSGLDSDKQTLLTARIRKRPPRSQWPRKADPKHVDNARTYRAVRELRRIEIAGARLPTHNKTWLDERIPDFPDLAQMVRLKEGFLDSVDTNLASSQPDRRYDLLSGKERLEALEAALSSSRSGWADDPREHATDWIRQAGNPVLILSDLESIPDGGAAFAKVWNRFGWAHAPTTPGDDDKIQLNLIGESARVLSLLVKLPESTLRDAIEGISEWLSVWQKQIIVQTEGLSVSLKLWPVAVDITNAQQPLEEEPDLNKILQSSDDNEPMDLDTLNTPAGKLVGVFLASCPNLRESRHPFELDGTLHTMRDAIITAPFRAGLIARHRMIEALSYFLNADGEWAQKNLITPLISDTPESLALWRAIARQVRYSNVIKIIGGTMADRATDGRLGRETRSSLVFSLFIECLHAFREQREPSVPYVRIQQMIRSLDDEVRAHGAEAVHTFVHDVSAPSKTRSEVPSPEALFRTAVAPFLQDVWPQERSLATPGVSRAFAKLPAVAQEAFAEVVEVIEPFLVPFECWSLIDYGLYGEENGEPKLSSINSRDKAAALLRLLDLTIGTAEGSVIPHHLAEALDQVRRVAPNLAEGQVFRRLATAARRR